MLYVQASAWVEENPAIAKLLVEDVVEWIRKTGAESGAPDGARLLLTWTGGGSPGAPEVEEGWREDELVMEYLRRKGLD